MEPLPPIERSISVSWDPPAAFRRFTADFGVWWPWRSHSVGGERVRRLVFEGRVDGLIAEEHADGRRFQWGRVIEWDPPRSVRFTWHPARGPETAQDVRVTFEPEGSGTRVVLESSGWERFGAKARRARKGYRVGWGYVLNVFGGRRTAGMALLDGIAAAASALERLRGGSAASVARAGGELPRA